MQFDGSEDFEKARHELRVARALASELVVSIERCQKALEKTAFSDLKTGIEHPIESTPPLSMHRASHLRGGRSRLDTDPELLAFVRARIDRLTFAQIVDAVAGHFPSDRHTSISALHRWFHRQRCFSSTSGSP